MWEFKTKIKNETPNAILSLLSIQAYGVAVPKSGIQ
jgi:hypothetical protein